MTTIADIDKAHVWHPFTPLDYWLDPQFEPVVIAEGEGPYLIDTQGHRYLDTNASIWTNLHGHRHPHITEAIKKQLDRIAHSSFLGLTNELAPILAQRLTRITAPHLTRTFFADNGSTAIETALKIIVQYLKQNGQQQRRNFISLSSGYHGDTVGAMSLGHDDIFQPFKGILFPTTEIMNPYCYHCPFNKAQPEKTDARLCRKCNWECVSLVEKEAVEKKETLAGFIMEPRIQGAAGMIMHPEGYLKKVCDIIQQNGGRVILDEVMTGFGRTGSLFAFHKENIQPDAVALAKGITGGYLPLSATMITEEIFQGFRGGLDRTLYHGHSYTGNQLGCAAALANLDFLEKPDFLPLHQKKCEFFKQLCQRFWQHPNVGDVRVEGLVMGVELVEDFAMRKTFNPSRRIGFHISENARKYGLLARGIGTILILMPTYAANEEQLEQMVDGLYRSLCDILPF